MKSLGIVCAVCRHYAWHHTMTVAVHADGGRHHPACPRVAATAHDDARRPSTGTATTTRKGHR